MGLFTSACKNCGGFINWFLLPKGEKIKCSHCNTPNISEELYENMLNSNEVNVIRRNYLDKKLYEKEVNDYITGETKN